MHKSDMEPDKTRWSGAAGLRFLWWREPSRGSFSNMETGFWWRAANSKHGGREVKEFHGHGRPEDCIKYRFAIEVAGKASPHT